MLRFLEVNQLPLRGDECGFEKLLDDNPGLFLSLFECTLAKDPELTKIVPTIPENARYVSPEIQNEMIAIMSSVVTEEIVKEVG